MCAASPYSETHLGHARAYVTFDILRRFLEWGGAKVKYVQNITDVDDKIIARAATEKKSTSEVAEKYTNDFFEMMDLLGVDRATMYPKATDHIPDMIRMIEGLVKKEFAYPVGGDVYFDVAKFSDYGKLSNQKLDEIQPGARIAVGKKKRTPLDFALWKAAKAGEPAWKSPWGVGRPGWHIECSAMSMKYLGEQFDIHGGGLDLVFPHHENEIAQSEAHTGKTPWVAYWIHNGFVTVNKEKMSKSLGNVFQLRDIFRKYDPMVVRFFLASTHYRSPIDYSTEQVESAQRAYEGLAKSVDDALFVADKKSEDQEVVHREIKKIITGYEGRFLSAMEDDLNTAAAISIIFEFANFGNKLTADPSASAHALWLYTNKMESFLGMLGIPLKLPEGKGLEAEIQGKIDARNSARERKDFGAADLIRDELLKKGIILEDTPLGVRWRKSV